MREFFRGATTLRTKGEWSSLGLTLVFGPLVLAFAGTFIHEAAGYSTIVFLAVVAMVYVTLSRGQLIGSCVLIDKRNFPEVLEVVERCSSLLGVPVPLVFVRDDITTPAVAFGFGEPYSLVLSSHWLKHFKDDELTFVIGRELGHIAAGHVRITSLLSVNGRENALVSLIFGAFLRRAEYTADRLGLLCSGSAESAERAIVMSAFHSFGRDIDLEAFVHQREAFANDSVLSLGELLTAQPYATNRIARLRAFRASNLYTYWEERVLDNPISLAPVSPVPRRGRVERADCAGFGRRIGAIAVDLVVVWALFILGPAERAAPEQTPQPAATGTPFAHAKDGTPAVRIGDKTVPIDKLDTLTPAERKELGSAAFVPGLTERVLHLFGVVRKSGDYYVTLSAFGLPQLFLIYNALLVAICGQTLGMMIVAVKVTRTDFGKPTIWRTIWRYVVSPIGIGSYVLGPLARIEWHDKLSGTRVVPLERTFERAPALQTLVNSAPNSSN